MMERLQEEILSMTVRKELLAKAMEQINQKHQVSLLLPRLYISTLRPGNRGLKGWSKIR